MIRSVLMAVSEVDMMRSKGHARTRRNTVPIPKTAAQTVEIITERIQHGGPGYRPGDRLPNYADLAATIPTSVATLGRAMQQLRAAGLVVGVRGEGTWVAERTDEQA